MKQWSNFMLARSGIIAALYVSLTFAVFPLASGAVQFRLSEMLTLLPLFFVEAVPALSVGCLLSNVLSACALWDILLGAAITAIASCGTALIGRTISNDFLRILFGGAFPVFLNAFLLPLLWILAGIPVPLYWTEVGFLCLSQGVAVWLFGGILYFILRPLTKQNSTVFTPTVLKK